MIFLTSDTSHSKPLSKALPDRVFRNITLGDLSTEVAKKYVLSHLNQSDSKDKKAAQDSTEKQPAEEPDIEDVPAEDGVERQQAQIKEKQADEEGHFKAVQFEQELDAALEILGGRLTDLEFLARRMKTGLSPQEAAQEIIDQSANEIIKLFLLIRASAPSASDGNASRKYSTEQAWTLVKDIARNESLRYNEVLLSNTFAASTSSQAADGEAALESLANAELIIVKSMRGRPRTVEAGRPVYLAAFKHLLRDPVLEAKMDLAVLTELSKVEGKTIDKVRRSTTACGRWTAMWWIGQSVCTLAHLHATVIIILTHVSQG